MAIAVIKRVLLLLMRRLAVILMHQILVGVIVSRGDGAVKPRDVHLLLPRQPQLRRLRQQYLALSTLAGMLLLLRQRDVRSCSRGG